MLYFYCGTLVFTFILTFIMAILVDRPWQALCSYRKDSEIAEERIKTFLTERDTATSYDTFKSAVDDTLILQNPHLQSP